MPGGLLWTDSLEKERNGAAFSGCHVILVLWLFSGKLSADYDYKYPGELLLPQDIIGESVAECGKRNHDSGSGGKSGYFVLFQIF